MTNPTMIMLIKKLLELDKDYIVSDYTFTVGPDNTPIPFKGTLVKNCD